MFETNKNSANAEKTIKLWQDLIIVAIIYKDLTIFSNFYLNYLFRGLFLW